MSEHAPITRRRLLAAIGQVAGAGVMYQAMSSLGHAAESGYHGPVKLSGAKPGASVVVLGAGLAGMVAALELRAAGYQVRVLEYQGRAGGRSWTLRGGDAVTEIDGNVQRVQFAQGNYLNPGPWRVPYHHTAMLDYYKRFGVQVEPFMQVNYNAFVHNSKAFGGKPQRLRGVKTDVRGHVAELLAKAANQGALDQTVTREDKEKLLAGLKSWGMLDKNYRYVASDETAEWRGYDVEPGGGLMLRAKPSQPIGLSDILGSGLWGQIGVGDLYEFQTAIFEPVGGMDMLARALAKELGALIQYHSKVTKIDQDERGVTVSYTDARGAGGADGAARQVKADWCVCTIPLSILSQIEVKASAPMREAITHVPYGGSVKIGLEFKRRFWEEDERIYGGISYTNLPVQSISYPSTGYMKSGPAVLLGAYTFDNTNTFTFSAMKPAERVRVALEYGSQIHPQYKKEFLSGVAVAWYRQPWIQGCYGAWTDALREKHYDALAQVDGRLVLAGEHVSFLPAWQEGAVLSALDAITRLHAKAVAA